MENASKALIIAGAILLSILLISLGIMIYNQAQDTVNNSGMSQAEITAFNNKFIKYEGTNKKASEVRALINEVITSNADSSTPTVNINGSDPTASGAAKTLTSGIDNTKTYTVTLSYDNGYVKNVAYSAI